MSENQYKGIPKLTPVTYAVWKHSMNMALQSEGCLEIVENEEDQPEPKSHSLRGQPLKFNKPTVGL